MYRINYADGRTETMETLDKCHETLEIEYPDVVYCDNGESVHRPYQREIDDAGRILVWANEDDADGHDGMGDGGQNAVAEIVEE